MGHLVTRLWGTLNMDLEGGPWGPLAVLLLLEMPVLWELLSTSFFFPIVCPEKLRQIEKIQKCMSFISVHNQSARN